MSKLTIPFFVLRNGRLFGGIMERNLGYHRRHGRGALVDVIPDVIAIVAQRRPHRSVDAIQSLIRFVARQSSSL